MKTKFVFFTIERKLQKKTEKFTESKKKVQKTEEKKHFKFF